jgi:hypothetical protein
MNPSNIALSKLVAIAQILDDIGMYRDADTIDEFIETAHTSPGILKEAGMWANFVSRLGGWARKIVSGQYRELHRAARKAQSEMEKEISEFQSMIDGWKTTGKGLKKSLSLHDMKAWRDGVASLLSEMRIPEERVTAPYDEQHRTMMEWVLKVAPEELPKSEEKKEDKEEPSAPSEFKMPSVSEEAPEVTPEAFEPPKDDEVTAPVIKPVEPEEEEVTAPVVKPTVEPEEIEITPSMIEEEEEVTPKVMPEPSVPIESKEEAPIVPEVIPEPSAPVEPEPAKPEEKVPAEPVKPKKPEDISAPEEVFSDELPEKWDPQKFGRSKKRGFEWEWLVSKDKDKVILPHNQLNVAAAGRGKIFHRRDDLYRTTYGTASLKLKTLFDNHWWKAYVHPTDYNMTVLVKTDEKVERPLRVGSLDSTLFLGSERLQDKSFERFKRIISIAKEWEGKTDEERLADAAVNLFGIFEAEEGE